MTIDVVTIASLLGGLIGVAVFLLRLLIASKNDQIRTLEYELRDVTAERDLFRGMAMIPRDHP